ncbi:MAG: LacI family DNA-binding transcriptional regulator, partial [Ornithinibacter sp.]
MNESRSARLADIAAQADVSEATVSRVLNDRPGVSDSTRQAVLTAIDVLGYDRPTRLKPKSALLVGLVMPELVNPIFPAFAQVIETALAAEGFTPVLCTQTPGGVHEDDYTELLLERSVSGILFVSGVHADTLADHQRYRDLLDRGLPIVLINGYADDIDAPFVSCDDAAASALAVRHLVDLGHRRIGLAVGPDRFVPAIRKIAGFREAMAAHAGEGEPRIERSL